MGGIETETPKTIEDCPPWEEGPLVWCHAVGRCVGRSQLQYIAENFEELFRKGSGSNLFACLVPPPCPGTSEWDPNQQVCLGNDAIACGLYCPYWWGSCEECDCYVGGGGITFNYIPPSGKGNLFHYLSPNTPTQTPNQKDIYSFIPGTVIPWCPKQCTTANCNTYVKCPHKCLSQIEQWFGSQECNESVNVSTSWNLTDLFSGSLIQSQAHYLNETTYNTVQTTRYEELFPASLENKDIGLNPIRTLNKNWFVMNTRGLGSSVNFSQIQNFDSSIPAIKSEWQSDGIGAKPDYLQVVTAMTFGTIIHSNASYNLAEKVFENTILGATGLNEPNLSSLYFWKIPKDNSTAQSIVDHDGLITDDKKIKISTINSKSPFSSDEFNIPHYISSAKGYRVPPSGSQEGEVSGYTLSDGDLFGTIWTNSIDNPYRTFGMNLYSIKEDSSDPTGITWSWNYIPKHDSQNWKTLANTTTYGIRPDLIIWKLAHKIYPNYFMKGFTGIDGISNSIGTHGPNTCHREWYGYFGQTGMADCNDTNLQPTSLYYKQISLGERHGLVTLSHYEREYDSTDLQLNQNNINTVGENIWNNRKEKTRYLFSFSGLLNKYHWPLQPSDSPNPHLGPAPWSDPNDFKIRSISDSFDEQIPVRLISYENVMDYIYYYGISLGATQAKIPDFDNNVCRCENPPNTDSNDNYIINPLVTIGGTFFGLGVTSCFKEGHTFGSNTHPIWPQGMTTESYHTDPNNHLFGGGYTRHVPSVAVFDAFAIAKIGKWYRNGQVINNDDITEANWDWISAGGGTRSAAVISMTLNDNSIVKAFTAWASSYVTDTPAGQNPWPQHVWNYNLHQHTESVTGPGCVDSFTATWAPCQIEISSSWDNPSHINVIYYTKTLPYLSWHESKNEQLNVSTYNTMGKVYTTKQNPASGEVIYESHSATPGIEMPVHYTLGQNTALNRQFNRRFQYPSGYNYFQSDLFTISEGNTYPFLVEDWLQDPIKTVGLGSYYSNFSSSELFNNTIGVWPTIPFWLRNYYLPSWTPRYPVMSATKTNQDKGDYHWINNIYNDKMPYSCSACVVSSPSCIQINNQSITRDLNNTQQSITIHLTFNPTSPLCGWTIIENIEWLTVTPVNGTTNTITISVDANTGNYRSGSFNIIQSNITKTITINQQGSDSNSTGACCTGTVCNITTWSNCSGTYKGDNSTCTPTNPCSDGGGTIPKDCCDYFIGPCCNYPTGCEYLTPQGCKDRNGIFLGFNQTCDNCPS